MAANETMQVADSVRGAAKALRDMAVLTANNTKNWDNYEQICVQVLDQVYEAGSAAEAAARKT